MERSVLRPLAPPRNLTDALVARLTEEITGGTLAPGDRLPTEQAMIASFGVSRTVIREAVAALKADGLVVTRQGSGAFVATDARRRPFRIDPERLGSIHEVLQVMELRTCVEVEAAGLAATRRTRDQLRATKSALDAMEVAIAAGDPAVDADFEFHRSIADATGNPYYVKFQEFLGNFIIPRQSIRLERYSPSEQRAYLARVQAEHRDIYRAIAARDEIAAREAARHHLVGSRKRYQRLAEEEDAGARP